MKFVNLFEHLDKKEKVRISSTEILEGNHQGEKRIVLNRENHSPVIVSNYNYYKLINHIGEEVMTEIYETKLSKLIVYEGEIKQVRVDLEDIING